MDNKMKILRIALLIFLMCLAISTACIFNKKSTPRNKLHVLRGHQDLVASLTFSPNGKYIASADESGVIKLWSVATFKLVKQFELQRRISEILFLPDNKTLVSSDFKGNLIFWDIKTCKIKWHYKADPILLMSASDNGTIAISTWSLTVNEPEKNQIIFIDYRNNKIIKKWEMDGISRRPKAIGLSHDGKQIAYITMDDTFLLKNVNDGLTVWKLRKPAYGTFKPRNGIEFFPDNARIATTYSSMNASAQIVQSSDGAKIAEIGLSDKVTGKGIAVSYMPRSEKLLVLTAHEEIVVADMKGSVKVYRDDSDVSYTAIQSSPIGEIFAISNGKNVEIWSVN